MILSKDSPDYKQCTLSVLDNIADPNITFDENGICNYYYNYLKTALQFSDKNILKSNYRSIIENLKKQKKSRKYDCIIGVSGGVDSSYLCYLAYKEGLKVLCIHFDNGWNSELAVDNIKKIINYCGFDLYTYVINWEEFKDIQLSYIKSNVIDLEAVTDIAIFDALDHMCDKFQVPFILDGRNFVTESVIPSDWVNKNPNNLYDIHKKYGNIELNDFPAKFKNGVYRYPKGNFKSIPLLNYIDYNKKNVIKIISNEMGWRDYGGKHFESIFTRFYQGYILPVKFKVDKRKAHLSNLIFSGQITKDEALYELSKPIYPKDLLEKDKAYVIKKLGLDDCYFDKYLNQERVSHDFFNNIYPIKEKKNKNYFNLFKKILLTPKKFLHSKWN